MKFKVEYNPDFFDDITEAVDWYNEKQIGLGERFFKAVKQETAKLSGSALHYAIRYDDIRCVNIEKFPYLIHYRLDEANETVKVEAMFHVSRDPKIWDNLTDN